MFTKSELKGKRNHKNKRNPLAKALERKEHRQRVINKKVEKNETIDLRDVTSVASHSPKRVPTLGRATGVGALMNEWHKKNAPTDEQKYRYALWLYYVGIPPEEQSPLSDAEFDALQIKLGRDKTKGHEEAYTLTAEEIEEAKKWSL